MNSMYAYSSTRSTSDRIARSQQWIISTPDFTQSMSFDDAATLFRVLTFAPEHEQRGLEAAILKARQGHRDGVRISPDHPDHQNSSAGFNVRLEIFTSSSPINFDREISAIAITLDVIVAAAIAQRLVMSDNESAFKLIGELTFLADSYQRQAKNSGDTDPYVGVKISAIGQNFWGGRA